jgi:helicase
MAVRSGIGFKISLLGAIEGLGYMRGNALKRAGELLKLEGEVPLINGIKEGMEEYYEALREALAFRYQTVKEIEKELKAIVKAVTKTKFPLGNERLLKYLASLFVGRERAIRLTKEEALEVLRENVKGEETFQS